MSSSNKRDTIVALSGVATVARAEKRHEQAPRRRYPTGAPPSAPLRPLRLAHLCFSSVRCPRSTLELQFSIGTAFMVRIARIPSIVQETSLV